jgi:HK97 family phage major capsid protein
MDNYKDLMGQAKKLFEDARVIVSNPEAPADEKAKVEQILADAQDLKAKALKLQEIEANIGDMLPHMEDKSADKEIEERKDFTKFSDWGEFLQAVHTAQQTNGQVKDNRLQMFKEDKAAGHDPKPSGRKAPMVEGVGASGGFLVPAEFRAQLMSVMGESSIVRGRATPIRMARRQIDIPVLDQTATTAGVPHWFGGMQFYWSEEAAEKTVTDADFRQVSLIAHKLIGYTRASDELVDDAAISLADFISGPLGFAGGVAWMEDYAFLRGTGAGQPLGVVNAGATITVARQAVATPIQYVDLVNMLEEFLPSARGVWCITQGALSNMMTIQDPEGHYIWQPNAREGVPQTIFGIPVYFTEKLPTIGNAGDVLLADFRYYLLGDRQATTIESTKFDYWRYDQTSWRVVHRVDGRPWLSSPLTLVDGVETISPFVILGAKST